jgi:hypothetical protein
LERVRVPDTYPRERVVLGELHLLRGRLDGALEDVAAVIAKGSAQELEWLRVEERGAPGSSGARGGCDRGAATTAGCSARRRVEGGRASRRSPDAAAVVGEAEFELTPLHHRLLAVMAADPFRVFGKDELAAEVWGSHGEDRRGAVKVGVCRVRQALVRAGAPQGRFMVSLHGVGWALTRPA